MKVSGTSTWMRVLGCDTIPVKCLFGGEFGSVLFLAGEHQNLSQPETIGATRQVGHHPPPPIFSSLFHGRFTVLHVILFTHTVLYILPESNQETCTQLIFLRSHTFICKPVQFYCKCRFIQRIW